MSRLRIYPRAARSAALSLLVSSFATAWLFSAAGPVSSAFPGRNGQIAFDRGAGIFVMNGDGTRQRKIVNTGGADAPVWSPNGRGLAFEESADPVTGGERIDLINANGSGRHKLTDGADPAWSPDGRRIVFEDGGSIFVIGVDGRSRRKLIADGDTPAWSPSGRKIAFERAVGGSDEVFVMNANGTRVRRLTRSRGKDDEPEWSPDGRKIAFVSARRGRESIFVMRANGTRVSRLTRFRRGEADDPAWSPDGRKMAFERNLGGREDIFVMSARGTRVKRLTRGGGSNPDWQRKPR